MITFESKLVSVDELQSLIAADEYMSIAADQAILEQLQSGNWIAGSIPYFMSEDGGLVSQDKAFVNVIRGVDPKNPPRMVAYNANNISRVAQDAPSHGFTILIVPATSDVHTEYAKNAPEFPNMFFGPIIGWVSGYHLDQTGMTPKVGYGPAGSILLDQQAVALHVPLPENQFADIKIVNLFQEGQGPAIEFSETGFSVHTCKVDGVEQNFAQYVKEQGLDTRLPLVADYSGIKVNVSIQEVLDDTVNLYAPVFEGMRYHFASPVNDYVSTFEQALKIKGDQHVAFSCNCILNFLYSELENKKTEPLIGPITFGEIAYQLLNQTLVYMTLSSS